MNFVSIHTSGEGADKLQVISGGNGAAYAFHFGEAGSTMLTRFFQGDDATAIREAFDMIEDLKPDMPTREVWLTVIDPYL